MEFDEAETSAEAAVVRAAVANRYLTAEQLREALLLREEFARSGQRVGLLQLLRQRHLPPHALPELSAIYHQVLSGLGAQPATYDPVPSGLAPKAIARARLLLQQHPAMDPPRVKVFVNRVGLALGYADSDSGRLPHAGEGSGPLVAKRPDSGRLAPDSARLSRDSGRLAPDSGRLIPHTAEVPAHGAPAARHVDSDSGRLIPHTAEVPAQPIAPEVDHNAATVAAAAVQRFGRYLVESELARGGMGVVYKAKDPHLERYVALKVMQGDGFELDPTDEVRFVREAKATAKMRHPNIVSVLDTGTDHGFPYLVMDLVQGESLGERIKRSGPLDPPEAARLAAAVARALDYSHQQGVLHRDVKPSNILLEAAQGTPLLTDFGLARNAQEDGSQLTGVGQAVGTPSYMAPEQATGERELLGPATDVYGLGATLYHMLAGHPPFRGGTISVMHAVVAESPKPLRELRESVPRELDAICMRCLAKDPASRFQSAGELAAALEAVAKAAESSDPE
ncbi:MAG: serine/threonine protein kinase, partial [Planctomycetes bacterium]|nr:serine/threonine protein kinase [Planctomycetota bacterium]